MGVLIDNKRIELNWIELLRISRSPSFKTTESKIKMQCDKSISSTPDQLLQLFIQVE